MHNTAAIMMDFHLSVLVNMVFFFGILNMIVPTTAQSLWRTTVKWLPDQSASSRIDRMLCCLRRI